MAHYAYTDEEAVIQISTTGPWSVNYLNPADDPRNKPKQAERDAHGRDP